MGEPDWKTNVPDPQAVNNEVGFVDYGQSTLNKPWTVLSLSTTLFSNVDITSREFGWRWFLLWWSVIMFDSVWGSVFFLQATLKKNQITSWIKAFSYFPNYALPPSRGGHGSGWLESTPAGYYSFVSGPDQHPGSKICEKPDQIPSHFSILAIAEDSIVISNAKPLLILGCIACSRSLNKSRILKIEKFPDPDRDSKLLEQEQSQSLKRWLLPPSTIGLHTFY